VPLPWPRHVSCIAEGSKHIEYGLFRQEIMEMLLPWFFRLHKMRCLLFQPFPAARLVFCVHRRVHAVSCANWARCGLR
jgi:hypothetical protein